MERTALPPGSAAGATLEQQPLLSLWLSYAHSPLLRFLTALSAAAGRFVAWQQGLEALVGSLMSPGAAGAGPKGPNLARPSTFGGPAAAPEDRRANRSFLSDMLGIHIRERSPSGATTAQTGELWFLIIKFIVLLRSAAGPLPSPVACP